MRTLPKTLMTILVGTQLCLLAVPALAGEWSGRTMISQLTVRADKTIVVRHVDGSWRNPDLCSVDTSIYLPPPGADGGAAGYREIYAMLLTAFMAGREVNIFIDGCVMFNAQTFPVVSQAAIY